MHPTAFFTASFQPWQRFHQWLTEIARFADSLDIGVRERNEDSSLSYWIRWRRLKKNKFEEGRANMKFSFGCVY